MMSACTHTTLLYRNNYYSQILIYSTYALYCTYRYLPALSVRAPYQFSVHWYKDGGLVEFTIIADFKLNSNDLGDEY